MEKDGDRGKRKEGRGTHLVLFETTIPTVPTVYDDEVSVRTQGEDGISGRIGLTRHADDDAMQRLPIDLDLPRSVFWALCAPSTSLDESG